VFQSSYILRVNFFVPSAIGSIPTYRHLLRARRERPARLHRQG